MTLDQLNAFIWVAKLGGVRRAATQMHLSQPAISARISALEDELGVHLFERQKNGLALTQQGVLLCTYVEKITNYVERIKAEITPSKEVKGILRLGVIETIAQSWLSNFLVAVNKEYPRLVIELSVDTTGNLKEQLLNRSQDLVCLMGPLLEENVDNIDLPPFELGWFSSPDVAEPDLSSTPIISFVRTSRPYHELMSELMQRYGEVGQVFPSTALNTSFEMIASGIGVGALPVQLAKQFIEAGRLCRFDPGWAPNALQLTVSYLNDPQDGRVYRAAQLALDIAEKYAEQAKETISV